MPPISRVSALPRRCNDPHSAAQASLAAPQNQPLVHKPIPVRIGRCRLAKIFGEQGKGAFVLRRTERKLVLRPFRETLKFRTSRISRLLLHRTYSCFDRFKVPRSPNEIVFGNGIVAFCSPPSGRKSLFETSWARMSPGSHSRYRQIAAGARARAETTSAVIDAVPE